MFVGTLVFSSSYSQLIAEIQYATKNVSNAPLICYMLALQTISIFLVPAFVLLRLQGIPVIERRLPSKVKAHPILLLCTIVFLVLCNIPGINLLSYCNTQFVYSIIDSTSSIVQLHKHSELINDFLLNTTSGQTLLFNIVVIAILPAIGEELFFRGLLQQGLLRTVSNAHIAIFATALIFSLFHNDVFNVVPRFVMGVLFGYLFFITNNIWYPIIAHCVHNATVVIVYFLIHSNYVPTYIATVGEIGNCAIAGIVSLVVLSCALLVLWRKATKNYS